MSDYALTNDALADKELERFHQAMLRHAELRKRSKSRHEQQQQEQGCGNISTTNGEYVWSPESTEVTSESQVANLISELRSVLNGDPSTSHSDGNAIKQSTEEARTILYKVRDEDKHEVILQLLRQTASLEAERDDAKSFGERLTMDLIQKQEKEQSRHNAETTELRRQLSHYIYQHPKVEELKSQVQNQSNEIRQLEDKLAFAVQKLHRSRQREQEMRRQYDPLYNI